MDFHSLAAAHMPKRRQPTKMSAAAEDRHYRARAALPRPSHRLLVSIATAAGLILLLVGIAQA
jgi:hypothetical protein